MGGENSWGVYLNVLLVPGRAESGCVVHDDILRSPAPRPLFAQSLFDPTVGVRRVFWSKRFKVGLLFSNAAHCTNPDIDRLRESAGLMLCTEVALLLC